MQKLRHLFGHVWRNYDRAPNLYQECRVCGARRVAPCGRGARPLDWNWLDGFGTRPDGRREELCKDGTAGTWILGGRE